MSERTDEILAAIAALSDRVLAHEARFDRIDGRLEKVTEKLEKIDQRISAVARNTLSHTECIALGIADARSGGANPGIPAPLARAAKGR